MLFHNCDWFVFCIGHWICETENKRNLAEVGQNLNKKTLSLRINKYSLPFALEVIGRWVIITHKLPFEK